MRYTNVRTIMGRLLRHPLLKDLNLETVLEYTTDFLRIVGVAPIFFDKTQDIDIVDYRGLLPCDFYKIIQVRYINEKCGTEKVNPAFRYTTDSFHMSKRKPKYSDLTYKLQGNCIFTSIKEGKIEIAYKAMNVDDEGYPLIPDEPSLIRALELYIKKQQFTIQYDLGKITPQILNQTNQDYAWAVGQCQSKMAIPSVDEMQSISNMWNSLLDRTFDHRQGFLNEGTQEHLLNH